MQHISTLVSQINPSRGGGRVGSASLRQSLAQCEDFSGLEEEVDRYDLLRLVKRVGQHSGFSLKMIQLLEYYLAFTRDCDWEEGSRPIVYQSLARTALDLDCSERHVRRLEKQLVEVGAITWNDSGNHKRYGQRDPDTDRLIYAFGVELTPLAYLKPILESKLEKKQLYEKAWHQTKREISQCRSQIRSLLLELQEEEGASSADLATHESSYQEIAAIRLRTHVGLEELRMLLDRHRKLYNSLLQVVEVNSQQQNNLALEPNLAERTNKTTTEQEEKPINYSAKEAQNVLHKYYKTHSLNCSSSHSTCFQESVAEHSEPNDPVLATGLQHITLKQVLIAGSDRFRGYLPLEPRPMNWPDVVEAAYRLRGELRHQPTELG